MKRNSWLALLLVFFSSAVSGQEIVPLFTSTKPLNMRATGSVKSIKKNSNDSTLVTSSFQYQDDSDNWITVPIEAKVRGNFRLKYCYFPPLKLKLNKKNVDTTLFKGNKALKLVVPCRTSPDANTLIRKEYLCYKFCEVLTPYYFNTRLANFYFTDHSQKKPREYELLTFFVEDNSLVAKRGNGKIYDSKGMAPGTFDEKQAIRNDYIQYMIGNADWSSLYQHNTNVLYAEGKYITLSYDFDMSGFVDAAYARENPPDLGTGDIRDRVYRGFCKTKGAMEEIRKEFLGKESNIQSLIENESAFFKERDMKDMHSYIEKFFEILKDDRLFRIDILEGCRTE